MRGRRTATVSVLFLSFMTAEYILTTCATYPATPVAKRLPCWSMDASRLRVGHDSGVPQLHVNIAQLDQIGTDWLWLVCLVARAADHARPDFCPWTSSHSSMATRDRALGGRKVSVAGVA